ncbi:protein kinase [Candidatus Uabimicrobium sp. HlEnr_7]|uniref:serine/threonine-protein kinase n=1 Tax=Candidatus Uabimicrobium helgolandensis TaxID=3095367 RepID=UPI003556465B
MNHQEQLVSRIIFQQKWMNEQQIRTAYNHFCANNLGISFLEFLGHQKFITLEQKKVIVNIINSSLRKTQRVSTPSKPVVTRNNFVIKENQRFLQYIVEKKIGHGGMGTVYKARDLKLERDVAIKVLSKTSAANVERFVKEARTVARLNHPYVVKIYEVGQSPVNYFTMEYIEGATLEDYIYQNKVSFKNCAKLFYKIAVAVDFIHKNEIIHRDIKPANIMIDKNSEPRLMDFGLAKVDEGNSLPSGFIGTPSYASPEQINSMEVDHYCDIYSLGATLYESLTKTVIFQGDMVHLVFQILKIDPVRPRILNPSIPRDLQAICLKCVAKKPLYRYKTASDLAKDLSNFMQNKPVVAKSPSYFEVSRKWVARNMLLSLFTLLLIVSISLALVIFVTKSEELSTANEQLSTANEQLQLQKKDVEEMNKELSREKYKMQLRLYKSSLRTMQNSLAIDNFMSLREKVNYQIQEDPFIQKTYLKLSAQKDFSKTMEIRLLNNLYFQPKKIVTKYHFYTNFAINQASTYIAVHDVDELKVIDLLTKKSNVFKFKNTLSSCCFHPYKNEMFVGGKRGSVYKIDLSSGKIDTFRDHLQTKSWIKACCFSPDGNFVIYSIMNPYGESSIVFRDWDTQKYQRVQPKIASRGEEGVPRNMELITRIACTKKNNVIFLSLKENVGFSIRYIASSWTQEKVLFSAGGSAITDFSLHEDNLVVSKDNGSMTMLKIKESATNINYKEVFDFKDKGNLSHDKKINSVLTNDDFVISCGEDKKVKMWNYQGELQKTIPDMHLKKAYYTKKSSSFIGLDHNHEVELWSLQRKSPVVIKEKQPFGGIFVSPQGRYLGTSIKTHVSVVYLWDLKKRQRIGIFPKEFNKINFRQIKGIFLNEKQILTRGKTVVRYWNIHGQNDINQILKYKDRQYTHRSNVVVTNYSNGYIITSSINKLCLWNRKTKKLAFEWQTPLHKKSELRAQIYFADFYDKETLIVGCLVLDQGFFVKFIDIKNNKTNKSEFVYTNKYGEYLPFKNVVHRHKILTIDNEKYIFFTAKKPQRPKEEHSFIYMFSCNSTLQKQKQLAIFSGHDGQVNSLAFSKDLARMVSAGSDRTLKIWDLQNIKLYPTHNTYLLSLQEHTASVTGVVFNKDCSEMVSVSEDKTIRIWSLKH